MVSRTSRDVTPTSGGSSTTSESSSSKTTPLRGMGFEEGQSFLSPETSPLNNAPPPSGPLTSALPKPSLKSRFLQSSYTKIYDLYQKIQKAKPDKQGPLLQELEPLLSDWLGRKDQDDARVEDVAGLLSEVQGRLGGGTTSSAPSSAPTSTTPTTTSTTPTTTPKLVAPPLLTSVQSSKTTPTPTPETTTQTAPPETTTPTTTPPTTTQPQATTQTPSPQATTPTTTPTANEPAWKRDPKITLKTDDIIKMSYDDVLLYLDTRPRDHVEGLGKDNKFVGYVIGFDTEKCAAMAVRLILRVPDSVVEKGASHAEAVRILSSQLCDKGVIRRLLAAEARVVIVPRTKLMTDLPEFAEQKGTYTFDGRPWDVVRGLGGKNTAITEENLLGVGELDSSIARSGWKDQATMEDAIAKKRTTKNEAGNDGPTKEDAVVNNPGVYCEGYSTTNHEFFHTIHQYGLTSQDSKLIDREYEKKKKEPRSTHWADGPRLMPDGTTESENYSSSTVYEYFAQTGCAYQGTNTGPDPYTGNTRNNGMSWVTTNEPGLLPLYQKICSSTELKNTNPVEARKKADEEKKKNATPPPTPKVTPTASPKADVVQGDTVGVVVDK